MLYQDLLSLTFTESLYFIHKKVRNGNFILKYKPSHSEIQPTMLHTSLLKINDEGKKIAYRMLIGVFNSRRY